MIGLEFICKQKNIQYKDLAEQLGIGKQSITNWVVGRSKIPNKHLEKLSEMLKIAPEWLQKEVNDINKVNLIYDNLNKMSSENQTLYKILKNINFKIYNNYQVTKQDIKYIIDDLIQIL